MDEDEPMDISCDSFNDSNSMYYSLPRSLRAQRHSTGTCSSISASHAPEKHQVRPYIRPLTSRNQGEGDTNIGTPSDKRDLVRRRSNFSMKAATDAVASCVDDIASKKSSHGHSHLSTNTTCQDLKDPHSVRKMIREKREKSKFMSTKQKVYIFFGLFGLYFAIHISYYFVLMQRCQVHVYMKALHDNLNNDVFGQELAVDVVYRVMQDISDHFQDSKNSTHHVLSFFGWTGVGKNHVTSIISKAFHNLHLKTFLVPTDFPHRDLDMDYRDSIRSWIKTNISRCEMNVFVFDELDKASPGVLRGLHDALKDLRYNVLPRERKWTLFILLSNSRAKEINSYTFTQLSEGRQRISISYEELRPIILENSAKTWYESFHTDNLIDEYVPFLPLNRDHVHQCIKRELKRKGRTINKKIIELVDGELAFVQPYDKSKHYSTTGCKRVSDKVDFHYPRL